MKRLILLGLAVLWCVPALAVDHKVVSGDTMGKLAKRYGVTVKAIQRANNRAHTTVYLGETLKIPNTGEAAEKPPKQETIVYTVRGGDSLYVIARRFKTTVGEIKYLNNLPEGIRGNLLRLDQKLTVRTNTRYARQHNVTRDNVNTGDATGRRVPRMNVSNAQLEVLARIVKGECPETTPFEGAVAVAAVVLNRVRHTKFPDTISGVAHQLEQFSCYNSNVRQRLYWGTIPDYAWRAARAALAGDDPTDGCTYYYNPFLVAPSWAMSREFVRSIGNPRYPKTTTHVFYRYIRPSVGPGSANNAGGLAGNLNGG